MNLEKKKWYIVAGIGALLVVLLTAFRVILPILSFIGSVAILGSLGYLIYAYRHKKGKRKALGIFAAGAIMFSFADEYLDNPNDIQSIEVKQSSAEKDAAESKAKKAAEQSVLQKEKEQERKEVEAEKQARQTEEVETALELAESKPTRENYDEAFTLISSLDKEDDSYNQRLVKIEETVQVEEEKTLTAIAAVEKAEQDKTRASVDEAAVHIAGLIVQNNDLDSRLNQVESTVTENERLVAEKERQAVIAAQQAEESRAAEQQKEAEVVQSAEVTNVVYVAPHSGSKYHYDPNCRGLNNANSVVEMSLSDAQSQGYGLCGWED